MTSRPASASTTRRTHTSNPSTSSSSRRLATARSLSHQYGAILTDPILKEKDYLSSHLNKTDLLDALLEAKKTIRSLEDERMTLKALNQRYESELHQQNRKMEELMDSKYGNNKLNKNEAIKRRKEIEKHIMVQQLKKQVPFLDLFERIYIIYNGPNFVYLDGWNSRGGVSETS